MKSKMLKRFIAVVLCMVIVLSGSEYMRAGGFGSEGTEELTGETTDEEIVVTEDAEAGSDEQQPVEVGEPSEEEKEEAAPEEEQQEETSEEQEAESQEEVPAEETQEEAKPIMELTYEDSQINIRVTADEAGNIPEGATLSVTPIERKEIHSDMNAQEKAEAEEMNAQYEATAEKLQEKAENEDYNILGFLAYDISFLDKTGSKIEPNGSVSVSMDYKEAAIPEEVKEAQEAGAEVQDVTLMHLEENSKGDVKNVVDMVADEGQEASVELTDNAEVKKAEFVSDSFSTYTLTWWYQNGLKIKIVDIDGNDIEDGEKSDNTRGEITVANIAKSSKFTVTGYSFVKATLDGVDGTEIKRVRRTDTSAYGEWQYSIYESGTDWANIGDSEVYFVYQLPDLLDLEGNTVSPAQHREMVRNMSEGDLPITWSRSATYNYNLNQGGVSSGLWWTWSDVTEHLSSLSLTAANAVWDGSRTGVHNLQLSNYLAGNKITAYKGKLYDSATWKVTGGGTTECLNRFRGTFDLKSLDLEDGYTYADYNYTIESVLKDIDNHIYINDNMFVFVYPTNVTLTDDTYMNYLAFWTGTSNRAGQLGDYNGRKGTLAYNPGYSDWTEPGGTKALKEFYAITNGWYANPVTDGAGGIIQKALSDDPDNTSFYIDVITHDNATGGGMYRLQINAQKTQKTPVSFYKIDDSTKKAIAGAKFVLTSSEGAIYEFVSGTDGRTNEYKLAPGTYTLEELAGGTGYYTSTNEWTVTVTKDGFTMELKGSDDGKANIGKYTSGSKKGNWYITNKKDETAPNPTPVTPSLSAPEHKKTIYKNSEDNYTLSLDVKGAVGSTTPIDVLVIVDESASMANSGGNGKTRMQNVNTAINTLVTALKASDVHDTIKIAVAGFAGTYGDGYSSGGGWVWKGNDTAHNDGYIEQEWINVDDFPASNLSYKANNGTNWQAGIMKGEELLLKGRSNASKYVIFLTDGNPTFAYDANGMSTIGNGAESGYNSNVSGSYNAAVREWNTSTQMSKAVKYIVDATDNSNNKCADLANDVKATELDGSSADGLRTSFERIAGDITKPRYTNVTITDNLSVYADFKENLNLHVYQKTKDGVETELTLEQDYTYECDRESKSISVRLLNGRALEEDVTYTVRFDVEPTEKAYQDKSTEGYKLTGDENTDTYPEQQVTSSGEAGFRSNDEAMVEYTVGEDSDFADYKHPVLQVEPETTEHSVEKQWKAEPESFVEVRLTASYAAPTEEDKNHMEVVPESYKALTEEMRSNVKLNADNEWKHTWKDLPKYYYYTDEDGETQKEEIRYSVEEVNLSEKYEATIKESADGLTTTIINSLKSKWEIVKVSSNSNEVKLRGAEFTLTGTDGTIYKGVSGENGVVTWTDSENTPVDFIPQGVYTLKETKAPGSYELSDVEWIIDTTQGAKPVVKENGTEVIGTQTEGADKSVTYSFAFANTPVYSLPSTGGIGTLWYTIGGMLLMMAAALILYKNKKYTK